MRELGRERGRCRKWRRALLCLFWLGRMKKGGGGIWETLCAVSQNGLVARGGPLQPVPLPPPPPPLWAGRHLLLLWSSVLRTEGPEEAAETFGPSLITTDTTVQELVAGGDGSTWGNHTDDLSCPPSSSSSSLRGSGHAAERRTSLLLQTRRGWMVTSCSPLPTTGSPAVAVSM